MKKLLIFALVACMLCTAVLITGCAEKDDEDKGAIIQMYFSDFPEISAQRDFDVCLCEATHYHPESALPLLEKSRFGRLIFIHIGNAWHDTTPISPAGRNGEAQLLELCRGPPYPVAIAHDGDTFWL